MSFSQVLALLGSILFLSRSEWTVYYSTGDFEADNLLGDSQDTRMPVTSQLQTEIPSPPSPASAVKLTCTLYLNCIIWVNYQWDSCNADIDFYIGYNRNSAHWVNIFWTYNDISDVFETLEENDEFAVPSKFKELYYSDIAVISQYSYAYYWYNSYWTYSYYNYVLYYWKQHIFDIEIVVETNSVVQKNLRYGLQLFNIDGFFSESFVDINTTEKHTGMWLEDFEISYKVGGCEGTDRDKHMRTIDLSEGTEVSRCKTSCPEDYFEYYFYDYNYYFNYYMCLNHKNECGDFPNTQSNIYSDETLLLLNSYSDNSCVDPDQYSTLSGYKPIEYKGKNLRNDKYRVFFEPYGLLSDSRMCQNNKPYGKWKLYYEMDFMELVCLRRCPDGLKTRYFLSDSWSLQASDAFCGNCHNPPHGYPVSGDNLYFAGDKTCVYFEKCHRNKVKIFSTGETACFSDCGLTNSWFRLWYPGYVCTDKCSFNSQEHNGDMICFEKCADFGLVNRSLFSDSPKICAKKCPAGLKKFRDENNEVYCLNKCKDIDKVKISNGFCESQKGCDEVSEDSNGDNLCSVLWT